MNQMSAATMNKRLQRASSSSVHILNSIYLSRFRTFDEFSDRDNFYFFELELRLPCILIASIIPCQCIHIRFIRLSCFFGVLFSPHSICVFILTFCVDDCINRMRSRRLQTLASYSLVQHFSIVYLYLQCHFLLCFCFSFLHFVCKSIFVLFLCVAKTMQLFRRVVIVTQSIQNIRWHQQKCWFTRWLDDSCRLTMMSTSDYRFDATKAHKNKTLEAKTRCLLSTMFLFYSTLPR